MSGGREAYGVMGGQAVVGTGRLGLERDVDRGSGGVTYGGGEEADGMVPETEEIGGKILYQTYS